MNNSFKTRTAYIVDSFNDYNDVRHDFVIVAVSEEIFPVAIGNKTFVKRLSLGVAVCCPEDEFDLDRGIAIAERRALKNDNQYCVYVSCKGMINTKMVKALLEQEAEYFKQNPGSQISGYDELVNRDKKRKKKEEIMASFNNDELSALDCVLKMDKQAKANFISILND